jgi:3-isopropylmalate/(R)-2-methylmalate dehydratase large subunit
MSVEGRLTLCNLAIELGAKIGLVAPDDTVYEYLARTPLAPRGADFELALAHWKTLPSDPDAAYDREIEIDAASLAPQISWGTSPEHTLPIDARVPDPESAPDAAAKRAWSDALAYMDLQPGQSLVGLPIERVFIGSCANGRLSDLEAAARVVRGRRVAASVVAWVIPGSTSVKRAAEARGLDRVFRDAGFEWREPGCSLCSATNGEFVSPGERCVSTTNRNFVGRQGPGARTHLAGAAMAAAAAVRGHICDVRELEA